MNEYIHVKNFNEYQHYKQRNISSWVKLFYSILDDHGVDQLPNSTRWVFVGLLLLAGKYNNDIPYDVKFLNRKICHSSTKNSKLSTMINELKSLDMIYIDSTKSISLLDKKRREEKRIDKNTVSDKSEITVFSKITTNGERPPLSEPYLIDTPLRKIVCAYKVARGVPKDDRVWDKQHWGRAAKSAKHLLECFKSDWGKAIDYMEEQIGVFEKKKLSWTLETLTDYADEWRVTHADNNRN